MKLNLKLLTKGISKGISESRRHGYKTYRELHTNLKMDDSLSIIELTQRDQETE